MKEQRYVHGVGMTKFDMHDKPMHMLAYESAIEALEDSNMKISDIDAIFVGYLDFDSMGERQRHLTSLFSSLFKTHKPIIRVPSACATAGACLWTALRTDFNNILVIGVDKLLSCPTEKITEEFMMGGEQRYEQPEEMIFPAQNALVAQQHFLKYGSTPDDLALISYKNHENGAKNPKAKFYNKKVSLEKIKNSPVVSSPLRLFDCSISVDGAASCVISKDKSDIEVVGAGLSNDQVPIFDRINDMGFKASRLASFDAFAKAGINPTDIDIAEIHDAFTIVELISYEDLGFCKKGEGSKLIRDGTVNLDGKIPVNTSGGLKAKGHPVGATGLAQIYELSKQFRNQAENRQVNNPKYGLAQNIGGSGSSVTVHILKKVAG